MAFLAARILPLMLFKFLFILIHLVSFIIHQSAQEQLAGSASDVKEKIRDRCRRKKERILQRMEEDTAEDEEEQRSGRYETR